MTGYASPGQARFLQTSYLVINMGEQYAARKPIVMTYGVTVETFGPNGKSIIPKLYWQGIKITALSYHFRGRLSTDFDKVFMFRKECESSAISGKNVV